MKLKCPNLLKPLSIIFQENYQLFYPSEPFRILHFQMRHPVERNKKLFYLILIMLGVFLNDSARIEMSNKSCKTRYLLFILNAKYFSLFLGKTQITIVSLIFTYLSCSKYAFWEISKTSKYFDECSLKIMD